MTHPTVAAERRHATLIPFLGALSALGPLSNDLFVPSLPLAAEGLGASVGSVQLTMSAALIGFATGQLLYGPLSDRFGRKPLLCIGLGVFVLACLLCASSESLNDLVVSRSLQGLGAAAGMVLARAIILDRWRGSQASRALSWVAAFTFVVPVLAPLAGGYLASFAYWQLIFLIQGGIGALCLLATLILLTRVRGPHPESSILRSFAAYGRVLKDREALAYMACMGAGFAGVMAFVSNSSFVFIEHFGLQPHQFGYCFAFVMLGGSLGAVANGRLVTELGISKLLSIGTAVLAVAGLGGLAANRDEASLPRSARSAIDLVGAASRPRRAESIATRRRSHRAVPTGSRRKHRARRLLATRARIAQHPPLVCNCKVPTANELRSVSALGDHARGFRRFREFGVGCSGEQAWAFPDRDGAEALTRAGAHRLQARLL